AQSDAAQELSDALLSFPPALHSVDQQRLAHQVEERHAGIERRERILEDHLHLATERPQLRRSQLTELNHRAAADSHEDLAAGRLDGPQHTARGGRLAAAALPDQAERLSLVDVEVDAIDRAHVADGALEEALLDREELLEAGDAQQGRSRRAHS